MPRDLQWLLDLEEIKQLRISYTWAMETSAPDELADLFTEDGWIDAGPWGYMKDQAAIRRGFGKAFGNAPTWAAMHVVTNPRIEIDGDTAAGTWYLLDCFTHGVGANPLNILGYYAETYRRLDGVWKISSMKLHFKWSSEQGHIADENPMAVPTRSTTDDTAG